MKPPILFLTLLILMACEPTIKRVPKQKEDKKREFRGIVKSIFEYRCSQYIPHEPVYKVEKKSCKLFRIMEFNPNEILIRETKWSNLDYPSDPSYIETSKLNESGLVIETSVKEFDGTQYENRVINSYNQSGFLTERTTYYDGELAGRIEYTYDEYNCVTNEIWYNSKNNIDHHYSYEYDNLNRVVTVKFFGNGDAYNLMRKFEYESDNVNWFKSSDYDENGNLMEINDKRKGFASNKIAGLYTYGLPDGDFPDIEYYSNGKVKTWHFINMNDNDVYQTYDETGRMTERKIFRGHEWQDTHTWKYREDGILIEESESTSRVQGLPFYKKTSYFNVDPTGNWVEKFVIDSEGYVKEITLREILYY